MNQGRWSSPTIHLPQFLWLGLLILVLGSCAEPTPSQTPIGPQIPSLDSDSSISIVTWNIEQFPQQGNQTTSKVKLILDSLNADFYCLQEIMDKSSLESIVDELDQYEVLISDETSYMHLAIIYKPELFLPILTQDLFANDDYNFAGRPPFLVNFAYEINGETQVLNLVALHMKCCGDGLERRHNASSMLFDYLTNKMAWGDSNFVVAGDWNDDIHDEDGSGEYSFEALLEATEQFSFVTYPLSASGTTRDASYPSYPSFIDNILVSQSLFDEAEEGEARTIRLDEIFPDYFSVVSDHRPVLWSFKPN